ncbi:hypothetical protein [Streptomyces collinus]|uniref:hypothetical protein n=1 Tax=Streptomyces collinus TaxID=42684 RepID=UPI0029423484|nr:hypothetical protein [Streptomyces collinus]
MRMSPSDDELTPHELRVVAGEALDLLRQQEEREADATGQRARWIAALGTLQNASPEALNEETGAVAEARQFLAALGRSSLTVGHIDDCIEEDTADWAPLQEDTSNDDPVQRRQGDSDLPKAKPANPDGTASFARNDEPDRRTQPPAPDGEADADRPLSFSVNRAKTPTDGPPQTPWPPYSMADKASDGPPAVPDGPELSDSSQDAAARREQILADLRALERDDLDGPREAATATCPNGHQSKSGDWCAVCGCRMDGGSPSLPQPPNGQAGEGDPKMTGLMELRQRVEQARLDVRQAQDAVEERELDVVQNTYAREAMHAAARQIELEKRQVELQHQQLDLELRRLEMNEREQERHHVLERHRLELQREQQREEQHRDLELREKLLDIETQKKEGEHQLQRHSTNRVHTSLQLTASATAVTVVSWLAFPNITAGISLLALSPFFAVLSVLLLLTILALSRTRATGPENKGAGISWAEGVRAVSFLPVAMFLVTVSALCAFVSVFLTSNRRQQLNTYAHRTLRTTERILLGR